MAVEPPSMAVSFVMLQLLFSGVRETQHAS
jgi:hypothetical protein